MRTPIKSTRIRAVYYNDQKVFIKYMDLKRYLLKVISAIIASEIVMPEKK